MWHSLCPVWVVAAVTISLRCSTQSLSHQRCSAIASRPIRVSSFVVGLQMMVVYSELVDGLHYVIRVHDECHRAGEWILWNTARECARAGAVVWYREYLQALRIIRLKPIRPLRKLTGNHLLKLEAPFLHTVLGWQNKFTQQFLTKPSMFFTFLT